MNDFWSLKIFLFIVLNQSLLMATSFNIFPLNLDLRYKETQVKEYKIVQPLNFAFSVTVDKFQGLFEYTQLETHTGNSSLSFIDSTKELQAHFLYLLGKETELLQFYVGLGVGGYQSEVRSQYLGLSTVDSSGNDTLLSGIVSIQGQYSYLYYQADFKLLMAKDYYPQPIPNAVFRIGLHF